MEIKSIYKNPFLKVYDLNYEDDFHYYLASRHEEKDLVCTKKDYSKLIADAVTCIVVNEEKLLVFYEYRYPVGAYILSVPSGLCEKEENTIVSTAIREVKEETGIELSKEDEITIVNPLLFSSPGFCDESTAFVYVKINQKNSIRCTNAMNTGLEKVKKYTFITKEEARKILQEGKDHSGMYYSIATWVALSYFVYHI